MEHYVSYMDRQRTGEGLHRRLLELNGAPVRRRTAPGGPGRPPWLPAAPWRWGWGGWP